MSRIVQPWPRIVLLSSMPKLNGPTAAVACAAIAAVAGVNVACVLTHQSPAVFAILTGASSVLGVVASAAMRALFGGDK
jgi:hypothetical protein